MSGGELAAVAALLQRHEAAAGHAINLAPSENVLSPFARLPFVLDMYGRYFFDDLPKFGVHAFFGGLEPGEVETEILVPLLRKLTGAAHVNVKALSGLNCMTLALAALTEPGQRVLCVPPESGGHASTLPLGRRLGLRMGALPMHGPHEVDHEALATEFAEAPPALIYIDQSTELFPIDPRPLRDLIDRAGAATLLHYDSSHVNGLVLGGAMWNPLRQGAHTFGGSTHKTLPGPHKGFIATDREDLAERIDSAAAVFVSQHQPAAVVSLAITLLELDECRGREYARRTVANARALAGELHAGGLSVAAADRGYTACHQVWVDPGSEDGALDVTARLQASGIRVNRFGRLPGIGHPAFRLSVAELTRYGAGDEEVSLLAEALVALIADAAPAAAGRAVVRKIRERLPEVRYCFGPDDLERIGLDADLVDLVHRIGRFGALAERVSS